MGVKGLTSLLKQKGFPSDDDIHIIPQGSTLAFDGNGLVFELFRRAYLRHFYTLAREYKARLPQTRQGEAEHAFIAKLFPSVLPLHYLAEETQSYLRRLTEVFGMKVSVYFDGSMHRYLTLEEEEVESEAEEEAEEEEEKEEEESIPPQLHVKYHTQSERLNKRREEQMNLQQYCQFGILVQSASKISDKDHLLVLDSGIRISAEMMLNSFPVPELLLAQVKISVSELDGIKVVQCQEEADRDVAMACILDSTGRTYAVALDSDFMIFGKPPNPARSSSHCGEVKYVPFSSLNISGSVLSGFVIRREELASTLGLPDDAAVVELSILMGNDYTKHIVETGQR